MKTVPLRGKKAAGRVALVDDEDYDLVMQYRWHVFELTRPGMRPMGPYATASISGRSTRMHKLLTGWPLTDHADHDGLNNQRYNLRPATSGQNLQNSLPRISARSPYKGAIWNSQQRKWQAEIRMDGRKRHLGYFLSDLEAAYTYDAAARELFGEFACPNFPEGPTRAMRNQWADVEAAAVRERVRTQNALVVAWWAQRPHETRACVVCGAEYLSRSTNASMYCSGKCKKRAERQRKASA